MVNIDELDEKFSIEGELGFNETEGDLVSISVFNKFADAEICLYGAQVLRFMPHGAFDVLWVSPDSNFEVGKAIRGGIPVCFPWFGPNPSDDTKPMHGFARLMYWDVIETMAKETGETLVRLQLCSSAATKEYWPYDFCAQMEILVGRKLEIKFTVENTGREEISYTEALHSYFSVSEIENISIRGLEGAQYYQGFDMQLLKQDTETLTINKEENRRYINTEADCVIEDPVFGQAVRVSKTGSKATVVWNPWDKTSFDDMPEDGYQTFVCVETANIYNNEIKLASGQKHTTGLVIGFDYKMSDSGIGKSSGFTVV
jgi:glucose-6-phosphate 1-epimerase